MFLAAGITMYVILGLVVLLVILLVRYIFSDHEEDKFLEDFGYSDVDLAIGNFVLLDPAYIEARGLLIGDNQYVEIVLPDEDTPDDCIRVNLGDYETNVIKSEVTTVTNRIPKKSTDKRYAALGASHIDPYSTMLIAQMAVQNADDKAYEGDGSFDKQTEIDKVQSFGNGGEFAGGGTSGSWEQLQGGDKMADNADLTIGVGLLEQLPDAVKFGETTEGRQLAFPSTETVSEPRNEEAQPDPISTNFTNDRVEPSSEAPAYREDDSRSNGSLSDASQPVQTVDHNHESNYTPFHDTTPSYDYGSPSDSSPSYDSGSSNDTSSSGGDSW